MPSHRRATSPHPRAAKARAPLTAPHNTRPCPAPLLAPLQRAAPRQGIKGCQSVWLCSAVGVIHSSFAQTGLCVHLTGAGLLNQRGERTHTGTGADILLIQARLGVCHKRFNTYRLTDDHFVSVHLLSSHVQHGAVGCLCLQHQLGQLSLSFSFAKTRNP